MIHSKRKGIGTQMQGCSFLCLKKPKRLQGNTRIEVAPWLIQPQQANKINTAGLKSKINIVKFAMVETVMPQQGRHTITWS